MGVYKVCLPYRHVRRLHDKEIDVEKSSAIVDTWSKKGEKSSKILQNEFQKGQYIDTT